MATINLSWPSGTPDSRDPEWIEAVRHNTCFLAKPVKFVPSDYTLFPFGENYERGLILRTDMMLDYNSDIMELLTHYRNHLIKPDDPLDVPQIVNPAWTINTIMAVIGGDELPDPQYNTLDNELWISRMKQILDLLKWPIIGDDDDDPFGLNGNILRWNQYSYSCEAEMIGTCRRRNTPPSQTITRCMGWEYRNSGFARHTNEDGSWVVDLDEVFSEDSGIHCPPCIEANFDWPPADIGCDWTGEERATLWCPEYVSPTFGLAYLKTGVIWCCEPINPPRWYRYGHKFCYDYARSGASGSVTMSRPVVHPERIPDDWAVQIFLVYTEEEVEQRMNLGLYDNTMETVELPNPFGEYDSIELPPNPPKWGAETLSRSQSVTARFAWQYTGTIEATE